MLLGRRTISPVPPVGIATADKRRLTIDYSAYLDTTETLSTVTFAVDVGPATVPSSSIAGDGKSVTFFVKDASTSFPLFNVYLQATTNLGQVKNDHIEFDVKAS